METKALIFESAEEFKHLEKNPIAFFCAEYAFDEDASMYAGGLGVLAGDFILESAEENLPFIALGLWYGGPKENERAKAFSILKKDGVSLIVDVPCGSESIKARVWARRFGKSVYLLLLDTNISENSPENQIVSNHLYDPNFQIRLKQGIVLGIGSVKLLKELSITPSIYHLNEGHTAFAVLELIVEQIRSGANSSVVDAVLSIKKKIVATKHTIFSVAGLSMHEDELLSLVGPYCTKNNVSMHDIFLLGAVESLEFVFSTTKFLLSSASRQNGVSVLHTVSEKKTHPNSVLFPITNGVFEKRWKAREWNVNRKLSDEEFWKIKQNLRTKLVNFVALKTGVILDSKACTIVWARRFASYKRPEILFSDLERLEKICSGNDKVQFIISGKAYVSNLEGQKMIEKIKAIVNNQIFKNKIVYLGDYSIPIATELIQGADVWLNTPERGFEACGTSGMKAGLNGTLQASVSDGWVDEIDLKDIGFILSEKNTAESIYDAIENKIISLFYKRTKEDLPVEWIRKMRETRNIIESNFTAKRMIRDYLKKAYLVV